MTVKELKLILSNYPEDFIVETSSTDDGAGSSNPITMINEDYLEQGLIVLDYN